MLGVLLTLLFVVLNVGSFRAGQVNLALVLAALALPAALGKAFVAMVRPMPDAPGEVEIPASAEPELYAEARRLATAARTRPPDRIVLVPLVNAYVSECGPLLGLVRGRRTLAIGAPLLDALTVSELRAVLGHEFGHFASGDTRLGSLAYRTEVALEEIVRTLRGFSGTVLFAYYVLQYRVGAALRRGQEVVADRAAVRAAGRQVAADALRKVAVAAVLDDLHMRAYLRPLLRTGHRPAELASGYRALLASRERVRWAAAVPEADNDPYASHPPTDARVRRIEALPELGPVDVDERAASALFADPDRWVRATYEHWLLLTAPTLVPDTVTWEAWPALVLEPEQRRLARDLDLALAELGLAPGVAGVRQAIETKADSALGAALVERGWRGAAMAKADVLRAAVVAATSTQAVAQGSYRWALSWDAAAALVTANGDDVRLHERVLAAVDDGDWSGLEELLGEAAFAARRRRRGRAAAQAGGTGTDVLTKERVPPKRAVRQLEDQPPPVPQAPTPPFEAAADGAWRAVLPRPAVFTRRAVLTVLPSGIDTGKVRVAFDDIVTVRLELLRQYTALGFRLTLTTTAGEKVMVSTAGWRGVRRPAITASYDYLWELFSATVAPRRRREIVAALRAGESVEVAGLVLSAAGVAKGRKRFAPWSEVDGPLGVARGHLRFTLGTRTQAVSVDARDAYLLPDLLPLLQALFE